MALAKHKTDVVANKGVALEIYSAANLPLGIRFFVLGTDSEEWEKINRKQDKARLEKQKRTRGVYLATSDETRLNGTETLAGLTTGWEEDVTNEKGEVIGTRLEIELEEGEFVPFSKEAVRTIYGDIGYSFIREQVDAFIGDRRNFLPTASRS
ncbi:MAG: hypothetical protein JZU65_05215 [Chlorobium sp.]|nr:hypothetical protein [Chlorobium sp.]